ncbi:hypothetical protein GCM10011391_26950 [Pullulanibacillus camelliae]|uniref:Prepilin-type N-terminal cleavage/methylation domain-containing protein n=1 Tax=Pullulanibacillus camelliae TaxID=1707096 RepID=A0A8J2YIW9_9BACL|nr:hypothetical protein GCM10011391_26950 [Pullulanibacillus camelliae]
MKPNEQGFTLLETMAALSILMVCTSFIVPIYIHTLEERKEIKREETALTLMNQALNEWHINHQKRPSVMKQSAQRFTLTWSELERGHVRVCLRWQAKIKRRQPLCGER